MIPIKEDPVKVYMLLGIALIQLLIYSYPCPGCPTCPSVNRTLESREIVQVNVTEYVENCTTIINRTCPICPTITIPEPINITETTTTSTTTPTLYRETYLSQDTKDRLNGMRWKKPGSPAEQNGYAIGKIDCLDIFSMAKRYNDRVVYPTYTPIKPGSWAGNNSICFTDTSSDQSRSEYKLNNSIWGIIGNGTERTIKRMTG